MATKKNKKRKTQKVKQRAIPRDFSTISACMIVKDEEKLLPQCLESIVDVVDEIVVVDTGSTDGTVAIAKSFGARVYHHPWENDFSKHRNQSIDYATGEWILIIDADEKLCEGGALIKEVIKDNSIDSIFFTVISYSDNKSSQTFNNSPRLFLNNGNIIYQGIVHNRLIGFQKSKNSPIKLLHYGYDLGDETNRAKFERTTALLKNRIKQNPEDPLPFSYMAASYLTLNLFEEAIDASTTAIRLADKQKNYDTIFLWTHYLASAALYATKRFEEAKQYCSKALKRFDRHLDSWYILSRVYFAENDWVNLFRCTEEYLNLVERVKKSPEEFGTVVNENVGSIWKIYLIIGFAKFAKGHREIALKNYEKAFNNCPLKWKCHKTIGFFHLEIEDYDFAEHHLNLALEGNLEDIDLLYAKAKLCGNIGKDQEKKKYLKDIMKINPEHTGAAFDLAVLEMKSGNFQNAVHLLKGVISKKPMCFESLVNLGLAYKKTGQIEEAIIGYQNALKINPFSLEALTNLGHLYFETREYKKAKELFLDVLNRDDSLTDIHLALGNIYFFEKDFEHLISECDSVLGILGINRNRTINNISDLSSLFREIGDKLSEMGKSETSLFAFNIALGLKPSSDNYKNLAKIHIKARRHEQAIEYLENAVRLKLDDSESFFLLGKCYEDMGVSQAAEVCFEKVREINPG